MYFPSIDMTKKKWEKVLSDTNKEPKVMVFDQPEGRIIMKSPLPNTSGLAHCLVVTRTDTPFKRLIELVFWLRLKDIPIINRNGELP